MPTVCSSLKVSRDGQYILAAGLFILNFAIFQNNVFYLNNYYVARWKRQTESDFHIFVLQAHTNPGSAAMTRINCL